MHEASSALARACVADLLQVRASSITLAQECPTCGGGDHGRPFVPGRPDVGVSWSHSRDHLVAAATFGPCGIDVEGPLTGPPPRRALTEAERRWVDSGGDFIRLWTRKEALVKAGVAALDDVGSLDVLADHVADLHLTTWNEGAATMSLASTPGAASRFRVTRR